MACIFDDCKCLFYNVVFERKIYPCFNTEMGAGLVKFQASSFWQGGIFSPNQPCPPPIILLPINNSKECCWELSREPFTNMYSELNPGLIVRTLEFE